MDVSQLSHLFRIFSEPICLSCRRNHANENKHMSPDSESQELTGQRESRSEGEYIYQNDHWRSLLPYLFIPLAFVGVSVLWICALSKSTQVGSVLLLQIQRSLGSRKYSHQKTGEPLLTQAMQILKTPNTLCNWPYMKCWWCE